MNKKITLPSLDSINNLRKALKLELLIELPSIEYPESIIEDNINMISMTDSPEILFDNLKCSAYKYIAFDYDESIIFLFDSSSFE